MLKQLRHLTEATNRHTFLRTGIIPNPSATPVKMNARSRKCSELFRSILLIQSSLSVSLIASEQHDHQNRAEPLRAPQQKIFLCDFYVQCIFAFSGSFRNTSRRSCHPTAKPCDNVNFPQWISYLAAHLTHRNHLLKHPFGPVRALFAKTYK